MSYSWILDENSYWEREIMSHFLEYIIFLADEWINENVHSKRPREKFMKNSDWILISQNFDLLEYMMIFLRILLLGISVHIVYQWHIHINWVEKKNHYYLSEIGNIQIYSFSHLMIRIFIRWSKWGSWICRSTDFINFLLSFQFIFFLELYYTIWILNKNQMIMRPQLL